MKKQQQYMYLSHSWKSMTYVLGIDIKLKKIFFLKVFLKKETLKIPLFLLHFAKAKKHKSIGNVYQNEKYILMLQLFDKVINYYKKK